MADVEVTPLENGPYMVKGSIELVDPKGNPIESPSKIFLCRCGGSSNKPFCDGTHAKIGFEGTLAAQSD